ncbi:MAG: molecular chaperone TorD family protein, partial [Thermodesulfobacteriota bacterium]
MMTNGEKERFCAFAAALFAPPAGAIVDELQRKELRSLIGEYARKWGGDRIRPEGFIPAADREELLSTLQREYTRLFGPWGEKISLVESTYKRWTGDEECQMVFAASKGLIMGDHALHMQELYRRSSLEIPAEYRSMPDHLVLELEFLALLYRHAPDEAIEGFIGDHLDWIPELREKVEKAEPHPFYENAVALLHLFLQHETENNKVK